MAQADTNLPIKTSPPRPRSGLGSALEQQQLSGALKDQAEAKTIFSLPGEVG